MLELTQREVARQLGIQENCFSEMIKGRRLFPLRKVLPLSQIIGLSAEDTLIALTEVDPDAYPVRKRTKNGR
jgi:plasmid maintenance system antidote protein VapI